MCGISDFDGGECEGNCLLGRFAPCSPEEVFTSETSVNFYQTARHNVPEDNHFRKLGIHFLMRELFDILSSQYITPYIHDARM
jgi:hypothetical protein